MPQFAPVRVYYEKSILTYFQGRALFDQFQDQGIPLIEIEDHNRIPELRELPDIEFPKMKRYLVLGIRKSLRLLPNNRSADFIVPFTSSGCSAMCLYCYLVCTFFKNSYLRIFINRQEMMNQIKRNASKQTRTKIYEIGSNSDLVLENQITGNLKWAIEEFSRLENARCTFATKFANVDDLLDIDHRGKTQIRISVNPPDLIRKVEIGTANLTARIGAANKMFHAGYRVGLNLAPIILTDDWQQQYLELLEELSSKLDDRLQQNTFFELIFMTYGLANDTINCISLPKAANIFDKGKMQPKGRGKYCYKSEIHSNAAFFFQQELARRFPKAKISYIV
ncbi:MAG: Spore photoproduct lyase [Candidatus Dichloromethanomonas elyunquensis]|nr:MAG: Spore photoproduct lyase [Candidatus Dichloromethanomonas elyunquensis]